MKILKSYPENLSMKELYDLTRNPEAEKMSEHKDEILTVDAFMVREETKEDGEITTVLSIKSGEDILATNSATFVREFLSIVEMAELAKDTIHHIKVIGGTSRNNRPYITCVYLD